MGIKTDTFFDDGAARRNRIIYIVCALVVGGCAVAFLVLSGRGNENRPPPVAGGDPGPAEPGATGPATAGGATSGAATTFTSDEPDRPAPVTTSVREELRAADVRFEEAMDLIREARDLGPASKEGTALKHQALAALLDTQKVYEAWLDSHPEDESRYAARLADIRRQVFWTRKNMPATDFPDGDAGGKTANAPEDEPATPVDIPRPAPTRPKPAVPPDRLLRRYLALVPRAIREGRVRPLVTEGRKLLGDERLAASHDKIRQVVEAAEGMVAFLDSAATALTPKIGQTIVLDLKNGQISGILAATGPEITLTVGDGESRYPVSDLSARALLTLAGEAEFLTSGYGHLAAAAYLFNRGDKEPALEQFVRARAQGSDLGRYANPVDQALRKSRPLQALAAWLELEPRLVERNEEILELVGAFVRQHRGSTLFVENREMLFQAAAGAANARPYEIEHLFTGEAKLSGRGKLRLAYDFDAPNQLRDFELKGDWRIEGGSLVGSKGNIWIERFDLTSADLEFTLPAPMPIIVGLWGRDRSGKDGVNLTLAPEGGSLKASLRHGNRTIDTQEIRTPAGPLTVAIQRRDEKYLVRLNRKVLLKGNDLQRPGNDGIHAVGIAARGGAVEIAELTLATTVDLPWAKSGGTRYSSWIRDWYVTAPFPVPEKSRKLALIKELWPETRTFDPRATGVDGKPLWYFYGSPNHWLDLNRLKPNRDVGTYQAVRVWSPTKRTAVFELIADDAARAWLNGDVIVKDAPLAERQRVTVKLLPGDNLLLVKVLQVGGGWYSACRFLAKSGGPMRDLFYW